MTEIARPLIKELTDQLWPLLEMERDREEWLGVALADLPNLRSEIEWSGHARRFTRRLVTELLTQQEEQGRRGLVNLLEDIADHKGDEWQQRLQPLRDRVAAFTQPTDATVPLPPELSALRDQLLGSATPQPFDLSVETVQAILRYRPRDLTDYRVARVAEWAQPRYALDKRFVHLALLLDQGEEAQGTRWAEQDREFQDLEQALAATPDYPALVLLGAPGSGKSTLLRHFELDQARAVLALSDPPLPDENPLTFFLSLNEYRPAHLGAPLPQPHAWLSESWTARYPALPPLDTLLQVGRMTLLLDALNEIPYPGEEPVRLWKDYLAELHRHCPSNRIVFSCRSLDYSASLSSPNNLPVPQLRIKTLSDDQVQRFLALYCPKYADTLWGNLTGSRQLDLLRTPYYLKLLVEMTTHGEIPAGRAALFSGFVRRALRREVETGNALFQNDALLTPRDRQRLVNSRDWKPPWALPTGGILIDKLSVLACAMQERHKEQEAAQVRIAYDEALDMLDHSQDEALLKAGEALGVLDEDLDADQVIYRHQLLQEYFAARQLAKSPRPGCVQVAWEAGKTSPSLEEKLATIADSDPLPPLPGTGWEETTLLAAAMVGNPDTFVEPLLKVNLPLAGRCAAQPDVALSEALKDKIRWALVERTQDARADLRARIAAGLALGPLGDPRFVHCQGPQGAYRLPPLVTIPARTYTVGSDEGLYEREAPVHAVELQPFQLGQFPVTNAEYALFLKAGGYEDERWWETEAAQAWRRGDSTAEGAKQQWREDRQTLQAQFDDIRNWHQQGRITSKQADDWEQIARMDDAAFEALLEEWYPPGRQTQPAYWNDEAFNNPAQPVVGICWHEARAYCAWLSAQTGKSFRLPTETEWEAAARGQEGRRYAYGNDFNAALGNTFETHIRRTTPIGVFPGGETPEGLVDMTGNIWDWTESLYQLYGSSEDPGSAESDARRVVRGGAWHFDQTNARAAVRSYSAPGTRYNLLGFRLACVSPI